MEIIETDKKCEAVLWTLGGRLHNSLVIVSLGHKKLGDSRAVVICATDAESDA